MWERFMSRLDKTWQLPGGGGIEEERCKLTFRFLAGQVDGRPCAEMGIRRSRFEGEILISYYPQAP